MKQKLVIQIDTAHPVIHRRQSPGVADVLVELAEHFREKGVQLTKYPILFTPKGHSNLFLKVELVEGGDNEEWEPSIISGTICGCCNGTGHPFLEEDDLKEYGKWRICLNCNGSGKL